MSRSVVDDIPGQGFLLESYRPPLEEKTSRKNEFNAWLDEIIDNERIGLAKVFSCNPDKCKDDCKKCRIFGKV